jgi:F0F1-type ATP synthase assembly protein I
MAGANNLKKNTSPESGAEKKSDLMRYMGLGAQFFATILVMLVIGWKVDQWTGLHGPVFIWVLPLLAIVATLLKIIIETNKKT